MITPWMLGQTERRRRKKNPSARVDFFMQAHRTGGWIERRNGASWMDAIMAADAGIAYQERQTGTPYLIGMGPGADRHA